MNQFSADAFCNLRKHRLAWWLLHQHYLWLRVVRLHISLRHGRAIAGCRQLLFSFIELAYQGLVVLAQPGLHVDQFLVSFLQLAHLP
jgi:hypothetical protein